MSNYTTPHVFPPESSPLRFVLAIADSTLWSLPHTFVDSPSLASAKGSQISLPMGRSNDSFSVEDILTLVNGTLEDEDEDDRPSEGTVQEMRQFLSKALPLVKRFRVLPRPRVVAFQHGIRITWIRPEKNVRFVWHPQQEQVSYIYQERVFNKRSHAQLLFAPADITSLVRSLNWLSI